MIGGAGERELGTVCRLARVSAGETDFWTSEQNDNNWWLGGFDPKDPYISPERAIMQSQGGNTVS